MQVFFLINAKFKTLKFQKVTLADILLAIFCL